MFSTVFCYVRVLRHVNFERPEFNLTLYLVIISNLTHQRAYLPMDPIRRQAALTLALVFKCQMTMLLMWGMLSQHYLRIRQQRQRQRRQQRLQENHQPHDQPVVIYERHVWSLEGSGWSDAECVEYLRFTRVQIAQLIIHLQIERFAQLRHSCRYTVSAEQALCMLLYRLASPSRLQDMVLVFRVSRSYISSITNTLVDYLYGLFKEKLLWDHKRLTLQKLKQYAKAIEKSTGVVNIWGFIDGTVRPIARPMAEQYSGNTGSYGMKFQSIVTPDGLISSLYGPEIVPKEDRILWTECGLEPILRTLFESNLVSNSSDSRMLYLYGSPAYVPSVGIMGPFQQKPGQMLSPVEHTTNAMMASAGVVVEWAFDIVVKLFSFSQWKQNQKLTVTPVDTYYAISVLLFNCHTILRRGNQISEHFKSLCPPPSSLAEYLNSMLSLTSYELSFCN